MHPFHCVSPFTSETGTRLNPNFLVVAINVRNEQAKMKPNREEFGAAV